MTLNALAATFQEATALLEDPERMKRQGVSQDQLKKSIRAALQLTLEEM